ncbi:RtcB family protein [Bacilliculturomica massiliensis]|uniref:RtcB family protein n=1 Tax=Bacilliculturomica massiliensis TaxID=1917867 RepID=UPI00102FD88A|nr:RtcB family protein [Bacilliculturomica massiliensis]
MIEIRGRYNRAAVYACELEDTAAEQIRTLCDMEFAAGEKIRIMPDVHAGAGCTIGTTMTITDKVVPNLVGVDIGCGMETVRLKERSIDLEKLDRLIYASVPCGFAVRKNPHRYNCSIDLSELRCAAKVDLDRAAKSIGTLGGGNHFIEVDRDDEGALYLVVHSGSRHLGLETANFYQSAGWENLNGYDKNSIGKLIEEYKGAGREKEIQTAVEEMKKRVMTHIPKALAYVCGSLFEDYIHDMKLVQRFAMLNRKAITDEILSGMDLTAEEEFTTIHNYIDTDEMILRKGAVSARAGEKLLIPMNMRDGSLICTGKGNKDWNCSAPHGAGRLMSRAKAKQRFSVETFEKEMEGVYTTSVNPDTLDECPMAYKNMDAIISQIGPTAEIEKVIRPIYNFKAGGE